jgi:hypothetical protein
MSEVEATIPGSTTINAALASISETVEATRPPTYPALSKWNFAITDRLRIAVPE